MFVLTECGTVPEYTLPSLNLDTEPEPLMKEVPCREDMIGNWFVLQQTRKDKALHLSEITFLNSK